MIYKKGMSWKEGVVNGSPMSFVRDHAVNETTPRHHLHRLACLHRNVMIYANMNYGL